MASWNQIRRRVIGPVMFLGGIALLAQQTCTKQQRTHATIVLELGDAEPRVRSVDAELVVDGETISTFHRKALDNMKIGPCRFEAALPANDAELRIDVDVDGARKLLTRKLHAEEGATVTVPLAREL
jgi:hypothetical protein